MNVQLVTGTITQGTVEAAKVLAQQVSAAGIQISLDKTTPTNVYGSNYLKWLFAQDYTYYDFLFPVLALFMVPGRTVQRDPLRQPAVQLALQAGHVDAGPQDTVDIGHELCNIQFQDNGYIIPVTPPVISAAPAERPWSLPAKDGLDPNTCIFSEIWFALGRNVVLLLSRRRQEGD